VYDVAGILEVFCSPKETEESISTAEGDEESEDIFPSCCSENIPCRGGNQTAEQSNLQNCIPLVETQQLQRTANHQW
jgi:hypothetical protein